MLATKVKDINNLVCLKAHDPVTYFEGGEPKMGTPDFISEYGGMRFNFVNEENKKKFDENPNKYKPQYGGWCAGGMSDGKFIDSEAHTFKIQNDRLFVFYNGTLGNARDIWEQDPEASEKKADENWKNFNEQ